MLQNKWFANNSIENCIIAFGTLFSNIELRRFDKDNKLIQTQKVPISYTNRDKLLARANEVPDFETDTLIGQRYPQMSFEMIGIFYDSDRKLNTLQRLYSCSADGKSSVLVPVPYNLEFELNFITTSNRDSLQILEQILPYFTPSFTIKIITIPDFPTIELPISLNSVNFTDSYAGSYMSDIREIIYTLRFTAKSNIFGNITDNSGKIIKSVTVNVNTVENAEPSSTLSVTGAATADLNNDGLINALDDALLTATDDFGFNSVWSEKV